MGNLNAIDTGFNYFDRDIYLSYTGLGSPRIKRDAFLYDQLIIPGVEGFLNSFPSQMDRSKKHLSASIQERITNYFDNVQYLFDLGYIVDPGFDTKTLIRSGANLSEYIRKEPLYYFDLIEIEDDLKYANRMAYMDSRNELEIIKSSFKLLTNNNDTFIIGNPILFIDKDVNEERQVKSIQPVINVILNDICMPSHELVWDDIFELKLNRDVRNSFLKLRIWLKKALTANTNPAELIDEYLDLKNDFEKFMAISKKKLSVGLLESVITTGGEIAENLLKFRFKDLAKLPFEIKRNKIQLDLEEFSAPGKEVGYTYKINQELKKY